MTVRASVIVPIRGDLDQAWKCFLSLAQMAESPSHEIVVVDDGAVGLEALLERLGGSVQVVETSGGAGFAGSVNCGAAVASGDVLVILRDTPEVDAGWLRPLVDAIDDGVVLASGVAAGQTGAHPVESPVVAIAPPVFTAVGGCPPVGDMYALPALCAEAARHGRLGVVRESVVAPASRRLGPPRHHRGGGLELSIVIPTLHAGGERVRSCLHAIAVTTADPHEVIVVDNGSSPQGYTEPVNAGIRAAAGRYVVVMNDDVEALPGWWPPLRAGLDAGAPVTFPTTIDTAMRTDFAAWCFALSQATIDRFGVARGQFFDARFSVWYQDTDLLVRLRQAGLPPVLVPESRIRHALSQTVNTAVPELAAWIRREVARDQQRFQEKHPQMAITPLGT